jgi:hypothetical protein
MRDRRTRACPGVGTLNPDAPEGRGVGDSGARPECILDCRVVRPYCAVVMTALNLRLALGALLLRSAAVGF